jgi:ribonuclease P/MRP protein subunit RPP40
MEKTTSTERHTLEYSEVERDLGIMVAHNLKSEHRVMNAVAKASMALSLLRKTFKNWTPSIFKSLYRPHLEYAAPAWSPYLKKDIQALENVQRRATKQVKQLKNLSYEERLEKLNLPTLEERRTRGDLIQFFKFNSKINTINWHQEPTIDVSSRPKRNSNQNRLVRPPPATRPQRENFFTYRVATHWNSLPQEIIKSENVSQFKNMLDRYLRKEKPTLKEALRLGKIRL